MPTLFRRTVAVLLVPFLVGDTLRPVIAAIQNPDTMLTVNRSAFDKEALSGALLNVRRIFLKEHPFISEVFSTFALSTNFAEKDHPIEGESGGKSDSIDSITPAPEPTSAMAPSVETGTDVTPKRNPYALAQRFQEYSRALALSRTYNVDYKEVTALAKRYNVGLGIVGNALEISRENPALTPDKVMKQALMLRDPRKGMGYATPFEALKAFGEVTTAVSDLQKDFGFGKKSTADILVPLMNRLFVALADYQDADVMNDIVSELYKLKYIFPEWTNRRVFLNTLRIVVELAEQKKLTPDAIQLVENIRSAVDQLEIEVSERRDQLIPSYVHASPNYTVIAEDWYASLEDQLAHRSDDNRDFREESGPEQKLGLQSSPDKSKNNTDTG